MITSRQNPRIKAVAALKNRANREREGRAVVYGVRESQRALDAGGKVVECLWCRDYFRSPEAETVVEQLASAGAELFEVAREAFDKLAYGDRQDGVVSVFETPRRTLAELQLPETPLVAVLEGVEKPGNLGAVLRSADGAGIDAVLVVDPVIDLFNPNAIRASVSAVFQANVVAATASEVLTWLRENSLAIWATRPDASGMYWDVDFRQPGAIVLGGEAEGLTDAWQSPDVTPVALPMHGVADSLNVSATAAVLFYEARRQRNGS
ncbi:TrmH family RNA methyltransferase [Aeoliella sp.]|uniref:TrmH family RNA methyltransferase n=1 Tax=Aeoliella sp. TaxID=2795800 RepID=UPI003CCB9951